jgi:calcineurin-like phosphoesterase family protein
MRYFIADTHFGCQKFINNFPRYRPHTKQLFANIEEHDEYLLEAINMVVGQKDELHILGDFCYKRPGKYRCRIKCSHVYLTRGNHDPVQASRNVFGQIPYIRHTKVRGVDENGDPHSLKVVLCHTPMAFWDGSHKGWGHLYGHTHGQREFTMDRGLGAARRSYDIGVDNIVKHFGGFQPIPEFEIHDLFCSHAGHDDPSFYPNNKGMSESDT